MNNLLWPSVRVAMFGGAPKGFEVWLKGRNLSCGIGNSQGLDIVIVPMELLVFRLVDIPSANRGVLGGQLGRFLPLSTESLVWTAIEVGQRSFVMAMTAERWAQVIADSPYGMKGKTLFIPSLLPALLHFNWQHGGNGRFALPVGSNFLHTTVVDGSITRIELREDIPDEESTIYNENEPLIQGAALYAMLPNKFNCTLHGRKPVPIVIKRYVALGVILAIAVAFVCYAEVINDTARLQQVNAAISEIRAKSKLVEDIITRNERISVTAEYLTGVNKDYVSPAMILTDISDRLPQNTVLDEFFVEAGNGYISGVSKDVSAVLVVISERPYMEHAEFATPVTRDKEGNERFQISFSVKKIGSASQKGK